MREEDGASAGDTGGEAPGVSGYVKIEPLNGLTPEAGHRHPLERQAAGDVPPGLVEAVAARLEGERPFQGATYVCDPYGEPSWWEREGLNLGLMLTCGGAAGLAVVLLLVYSSLPGWERAACALAASAAAIYWVRLKLGGHR